MLVDWKRAVIETVVFTLLFFWLPFWIQITLALICSVATEWFFAKKAQKKLNAQIRDFSQLEQGD